MDIFLFYIFNLLFFSLFFSFLAAVDKVLGPFLPKGLFSRMRNDIFGAALSKPKFPLYHFINPYLSPFLPPSPLSLTLFSLTPQDMCKLWRQAYTKPYKNGKKKEGSKCSISSCNSPYIWTANAFPPQK